MITRRRLPWVAQQNWEDILFIHQPVTYDTLRSIVPYPFEIDMHANKGWVSIVLFKATHSRLRYMPEMLSFPSFYQMNIRTYVRFGNERGVYFFKIHATNQMVNIGGNIAGLPFSKAQMTIEQEEDTFLFKGNQLFNHPQSKFDVSYEPKSQNINMQRESLAHFLAERYSVWMIRGNTIIKAPIFHSHWHLQNAEVSILESKHIPFSFTDDIIAHYADFKHTLIHPYEKVGKVSLF